MGGEREGEGGWREDGRRIGGFLVYWGPFVRSVCWWQPDRVKGRRERRRSELCLTQCTTSSIT